MAMKHLRSGYTTGACATAAAKGAALMLRDQKVIGEVEITLPRGEIARFPLHGQRFSATEATCHVVKDAGDDPDITNGAEIHATVSLISSFPVLPLLQGEGQGGDWFVGTQLPHPPPDLPLEGGGRIIQGEGIPAIIIEGGVGIGRVTKPGLAVQPGEWAINPVPRRMITEAIQTVFSSPQSPVPIHCLISIPNGELLAQKTLNTRLGIIGGLSILGTTGIVRPISAQAWTDTIDAAIDVALACGCETVVLSTGRTSEMVAQGKLGLGTGDWGLVKPFPEEAFVMMGDHVGHALRACAHKGVKRVVLAGQFAKLLKIACGHEQTHVSTSELDLATLFTWHEFTIHHSPFTIATTARGLLETSGNDPALIAVVCKRTRQVAAWLAPGVAIKVLLAGYSGEVLYFA
jgi:cobalt-precorrin-5B (C1)-methyltransferase